MYPATIETSRCGPDLYAWTARNALELTDTLHAAGALLFKRTPLDTPQSFESFARLTCKEFPDFTEESSPRHVIQGAVQTSTDYPNQFPIQFHSEYSYAARWPMKLYFCCFTPAEQGGETPISSTRAVLEQMSPATRTLFEKKGILYVRNYRPRVGVSWEKAFSTSDRSQVEQSCRQAGIEWEWRPEDVLYTRQYGEAIVEHPVTHQAVWFNHGFFFNVRAIEPKAVRDMLLTHPADDPVSINTLLGDGSPIAPQIIEEIRVLYERCSVRNRWERGDVLLVDNMLSAHARAPYRGKRSIAVLLADALPRERARS